MKKYLYYMFFIFTVYPSFATNPDIPANTTILSCNDSALNSDNSPVNIEVNWEPNEINLHWYANNTLMSANDVQTSCLYDDNLTPPQTIPTRTGYTFKGWRVRPTYDFSTLNSTENGLQSWGRGQSSPITDFCKTFCPNCGTNGALGREESCKNVDYADLSTNEFKVQFSWGILYGSAKCSATDGGTRGTPGNPSDTFGTYCWCMATGYKPNNSNTIYAPTQPRWIFRVDLGGVACAHCAPNCSSEIRQSSTVLRRAVLGIN